MKRKSTVAALLLALLMLLPLGMGFAEEEKKAVPEEADRSAVLEAEAEEAPAQPKISYDESLYRQIQDTYKASLKRARRKSFKGYCGAYVANQLVVLGINKSYLSANGKNTYDIYRKKTVTSGGYSITAYSASKYTLQEALTAIIDKEPAAANILVGFQKGVSKAGKKYGHTLLIHGVRNGRVYYSDSCARTVDGVTYKEGEPIVCPVSSFVEFYAKYKFDGIIHFQRKVIQSENTEETDAPILEKAAELG